MGEWSYNLWGEPEEIHKIEKELNSKEFVKEVALHEASHYVLGRLIVRLGLGFQEVNQINFCISLEQEKLEANVGVFWPKLPEVVIISKNEEKIKAYYVENTHRVFAEIFSLLAGYASYLVFIEDSEYFVSEIDLLNNKSKIWYVDLDWAFTSSLFDFDKARKQLNYLGCTSAEDQKEKMKLCINYLRQILSKKAVYQSIGYVKNQIFRYQCKPSTEWPLEQIKQTVDEYTKNFHLKSWLLSYASHF